MHLIVFLHGQVQPWKISLTRIRLTIHASFVELEGEGVSDVQQEILHRAHKSLNALRLRDRDLVLSRTWGTAEVDLAWARRVPFR